MSRIQMTEGEIRVTNLEFKKEFRACLSELSFLLFTLENGEENMFNEYYSAFAKSTPTTNKHILKMYNFYFSSLGVEEGDFNSNIVEQMKSIFEKRKLYYNFNDNMIYSTQEESKNIKV